MKEIREEFTLDSFLLFGADRNLSVSYCANYDPYEGYVLVLGPGGEEKVIPFNHFEGSPEALAMRLSEHYKTMFTVQLEDAGRDEAPLAIAFNGKLYLPMEDEDVSTDQE